MLLGKVGALSFSGRTTEDHGQGPEIPMTVDPAELFLGVQPGRGEPAFDHPHFSPASDVASSLADTALRAFDQIGGGQALVQGRWKLQPLQGEHFRQALAQAAGGGGMIVLQKTGQLFQTFLTFLGGVKFPSRTHHVESLALLVLRQLVQYVAQLVVPASLDGLILSKDFVNARAQRFGSINNEQIAVLGVEALIAQVRQRSEEHTSELQSPDHLVCRLLLEKKKKICKD